MMYACWQRTAKGDAQDSRRPIDAPGTKLSRLLFLAVMSLFFIVLTHRVAWAQATQTNSDLDQTLNKVFDSTNIALRVNAVATGGGAGQSTIFFNGDQIFNKIFDSTNNALKVNCVVGCTNGTGVGTVTSVGLALPSTFQVTGSPVTTSGTITAAWASQTSNHIFASPNGAAGTPVFRSLVDADLTPSYSGVGSCPSNQWVTGLSRNSAPTCLQPVFTSISGIIGSNQLPGATASALGAIQLTGDLGGTANSPKVTWLQGYPLSSSPPANGQCLVYTTSWGPGSCGGSGLPSSWTTSSTNNAVTAQPMAGQDAVPLTLAPSVASPTADIFDVCSTSPCSSGTKYVWVAANGNLNFIGNNTTYGSTSQSTQSFLRLYGSTGNSNLAPPYFDLEKTDGSVKSYLAPSTTLNGVVGVSSAIPGGDIQAPAGALAGTASGGTGSGPVIVIANSTTGTANGLLAKLTGSGTSPTATTAGIGDTAVPLYPVVTGGGTSGSAALSVSGVAQCMFDGATTISHFVQASTTAAGDCHDAGASAPTSGWVVGQVMSTNAAGGAYNVQVGPPGYNAASGGSGTVTSVGLTGTANQITVTGASPITTSGSWTLSIPNNPTLPGTTTGTFSGNLTGNVTGNVTGNASGTAATITGALALANTPLTTSQDILYDNNAGALDRLPISTVTSGQCLGNNSGTWGSVACAGSSAFSSLTGGTNTSAAMVVGSGASLVPASGSAGTVTANGLIFGSTTIPTTGTAPTSGQCLQYNGTGWAGAACSGGSSAFSSLTGGTNSSAAMLVGTGASLGPNGTGTVTATGVVSSAGTENAVSPVAATNGAMAQDSNTNTYYLGVTANSVTNSWPVCLPMDFSCYSGREDWWNYATGNLGSWNWTKTQESSNVTTPAVSLPQSTSAPLPDPIYLSYTSDATSGHGTLIYTQGGLNWNWGASPSGVYWMWKFRFQQPQASTDETNGETFFIGLNGSSAGGNCVFHSLGICLDTTASDTTWQFETSSGASRSVSSTGVSLDNNWHTLYIWYANVSTEFWFQLDNGGTTCFTSAASGGCSGAGTTVHNANLPGTSFYTGPYVSALARSANAVKVNLGRVAFDVRGMTSP